MPGLVLGRVAGIPVRIAPSWLVIAAVITLLYAGSVRPYTGDGPAAFLGAFGFALLLAASVLVHEATHAAAARAFGLHVDEIVVDLWGGHTSLGAPRGPLEAAVIAILAPLANIVLGVIIWVVLEALAPGGLVGFLLGATVIANVLVGLFNLLPGLPLDGGRVAEAAVWAITGDRDRGTEVAGRLGQAIVVLALIAVVGLPLLDGRGPDLIALLWVVLLGATLWRAAQQAVAVSRTRRRLRGVPLAHVARPAVTLPAGASLDDWARVVEAAGSGAAPGLDVGADRPGPAVVLVAPGSGLVGLVDEEAARAVPLGARPTTGAIATAVRLPPDAAVADGASTLDAAEVLARAGGPGVVVVRPPGEIVAWVAAGEVDRALRLRRASGRPR
jgi:Zn-dependent protease